MPSVVHEDGITMLAARVAEVNFRAEFEMGDEFTI
jgi:hypothetical protein